MENTYFSPQKAIKAQKMFCEVNNLPCFMPPNGRCFRCDKQIFTEDNKGGYTIKNAESTLITYCPFCHASFTD